MKTTAAKPVSTLERYLLLTVGSLIMAVGIYFFKFPNNFSTGGVSGLSLILGRMLPSEILTPSTFVLIINTALLIVGYIFLGRNFAFSTVYCSMLLSLAVNVMERFYPMTQPLTNQPLLELCFAVLLPAFGSAILFNLSASSGGTDIIALIINKYKTVSYGKVLMLCDLIIIGCSLFIFKNITSVIYGYVMVAVFGYTIDAVMAGNRQSAQILIVSPKYDQIAERIFSEMHRGVTLLDGEGWYTKTPTKVVMVVCRKNETGILFRVIKEVDPHAFMTFGSVMGVYGLGFEALKK